MRTAVPASRWPSYPRARTPSRKAAAGPSMAGRRRARTSEAAFDPPSRARRRPSSPACGPRPTTATSRPRPPSARVCCATPPASCPSTCTRPSTARWARRAGGRATSTSSSPRAIEELTRPGRRHQAPGEDGHRRHLPVRRGRCSRCRWCASRARRRASARRLSYRALRTLVALDPAVVAGRGLDPLPGRRRRRRRTTPRSTWSTAAASPVDIALAHRRRPLLRGTKHRVADEREVTVTRGRRDQRTVIDRARGQGQPDRGPDAAPGCARETTSRPTSPACAVRATRARYGALRGAVTETEARRSTTRCLVRRSDVVDLLTEPVYVARRSLALTWGPAPEIRARTLTDERPADERGPRR